MLGASSVHNCSASWNYNPRTYRYPAFSADLSQLTELLDRREYETIIGNKDLFFSAYCKAWLEYQRTTCAMTHNCAVWAENGTINFSTRNNCFNSTWNAIQELRKGFLEAFESGRAAEICLVTDLIFNSSCNQLYHFCKRIDLDLLKKTRIYEQNFRELSQASVVVDTCDYSHRYLKCDYIEYIQPVLPTLAQLCGFRSDSIQSNQSVGYLYVHSKYSPVELRKAEVQQICITQVDRGSAQALPSILHCDALRV